MKGKLGAALFCLAFALPFGGVGAGATWAFATMIYDGLRAQDWVLVKADVVGQASYRYTFNGQAYTNDRLGTLRLGGTSDVDDFDERVASILAVGREEKRPITVFVNPDKPSESMVDRTIRWTFLLFLTPFALAFGGVGVGALWFLYKIVREPATTKGGKRRSAVGVSAAPMDSAMSGVGGLWLFAIVWNAISFPAAALAVPQAIASGEWPLLFVLIFPLIGVLVLWGAISATVSALRRGRASFKLATSNPRVGAPVEGSFEFARGVRPGDSFTARLVCERTTRTGNGTTIAPHWTKAVDVKAMQSPAGVRVPFRLEAPAGIPATDDDDEKALTHRWRVELEPKKSRMVVPYRQAITMAPALFDAPHAPIPETPVHIDPALEQALGAVNPARLDAQQRQALAQMTPKQQAALAKVLRFKPNPRKIVIAVVCFIVAIEVVPLIFTLVR